MGWPGIVAGVASRVGAMGPIRVGAGPYSGATGEPPVGPDIGGLSGGVGGFGGMGALRPGWGVLGKVPIPPPSGRVTGGLAIILAPGSGTGGSNGFLSAIDGGLTAVLKGSSSGRPFCDPGILDEVTVLTLGGSGVMLGVLPGRRGVTGLVLGPGPPIIFGFCQSSGFGVALAPTAGGLAVPLIGDVTDGGDEALTGGGLGETEPVNGVLEEGPTIPGRRSGILGARTSGVG